MSKKVTSFPVKYVGIIAIFYCCKQQKNLEYWPVKFIKFWITVLHSSFFGKVTELVGEISNAFAILSFTKFHNKTN